MSGDTRLSVVVDRLDQYSLMATRARRAMLSLKAPDTASLSAFADLLEPQERDSAALDAVVFQVFLKTRLGFKEADLRELRQDLLGGSISEETCERLRSIAESLENERSSVRHRYGAV